jgi:5-methylcytosine-specific restriction endonuclease McrA
MATFTKVCLYCKRHFEADYSLANICSPDCQQAARVSRKRAIAAGVVTTGISGDGPSPGLARETRGGEVAPKCPRCGAALHNATGGRKYCSVACRRAVRRAGRRAKIRGAYVEAVSLAVLRERDRDTCRICGEPVDPTRRPPDPSAATVDHVIALSRGGEHSYRNTQLAHLRCNTAKGAGSPGLAPDRSETGYS